MGIRKQYEVLSRRGFMTKAVRVTAGLALSGGMSTVAATRQQAKTRLAQPIQNLGVQLFTLREWLNRDFEGALRWLADNRYQELEFAGYFGRSADDIRSLMGELDLRAPSAHISPPEAGGNIDPFKLSPEEMMKLVAQVFAPDQLRRRVEESLPIAKALNHKYLVLPILPPSLMQSLNDIKIVAKGIQHAGQLCAQEGLALAYHNHDFELQPLDGEYGALDILLQETDDTELVLELDIYWVVNAGRDPLEYFMRYANRIPCCHIKDRNGNGEIVDPGQGTLALDSIVAAARRSGTHHFFVEHDHTVDPKATLGNAALFLTAP